MARIECVGGPHDGRPASIASNAAVAFIDGRGHAHVRPARGRAIYRRHSGKWWYAGAEAYRCECGAFVWAGRSCPLCGAQRG